MIYVEVKSHVQDFRKCQEVNSAHIKKNKGCLKSYFYLSFRGNKKSYLFDYQNVINFKVDFSKACLDGRQVEMTPFETAFLSPYPQLFLTGFNAEWGIEWTETDEAGQNKKPSKYQQENSY